MLHKVSIHTNPRERLEDIHNRSNGIDSESVQRIHFNLTRKWKQRIQALNTIAVHYGRHLFVANKLEQGFSAAASFKSQEWWRIDDAPIPTVRTEKSEAAASIAVSFFADKRFFFPRLCHYFLNKPHRFHLCLYSYFTNPLNLI